MKYIKLPTNIIKNIEIDILLAAIEDRIDKIANSSKPYDMWMFKVLTMWRDCLKGVKKPGKRRFGSYFSGFFGFYVRWLLFIALLCLAGYGLICLLV